MTKKNIFSAGWAASVCIIALAAGCDSSNNPPPPPPPDPLELLYPSGGESFAVDSTIVIRWRINDSTVITSVMVKLSINNGMTYDFLISSGGSVFPPQDSISWTVDSAQVSTACRIRIYDYQDGSINDQSGVFTVHN
jgi:hypothetical protein